MLSQGRSFFRRIDMENKSIGIDEIFAKDMKDSDFQTGVEKENNKLAIEVANMKVKRSCLNE